MQYLIKPNLWQELNDIQSESIAGGYKNIGTNKFYTRNTKIIVINIFITIQTNIAIQIGQYNILNQTNRVAR